ncbi:hypothetical protein PENTCL1PPCAC_26628 [Pristionchus entomophagus]|uniref:Uncharacterized protein n=1 Tax=Pristionchus entomophagus TaxID=358040 RepID=A0AAV5UDJ8_9BILA|nr:hypothetical protein PENTCL1PPCAC_26628 [Pristionchus entomophagus]
MGGLSILLLLSLSISFSNGIGCTSPQECTGGKVCRVTIVGRTITATTCGDPLKADCEWSLIQGPTPSLPPNLAMECQCKTTGCDKTIDAFLPQLDKMADQAKKSVSMSDRCKTVGDISVIVYTILFGVAILFIPAIIFFIVRLFCSKRKMDLLEQKVTSSLRQLQVDMVGTSKNVHDIRKKMDQLSNDAAMNSGSRDMTATGVVSSGTGGVQKTENEGEEKKEEKGADPQSVDPMVKSVTLAPK